MSNLNLWEIIDKSSSGKSSHNYIWSPFKSFIAYHSALFVSLYIMKGREREGSDRDGERGRGERGT